MILLCLPCKIEWIEFYTIYLLLWLTANIFNMSEHGDDVICVLCDLVIDEDKFAVCDSCRRAHHYSCAKITSTEQRALELKSGRKLNYFCDDCAQGLRILPSIIKSISDLKHEFETLKKAVIENKQDNIQTVRDESNTINFETILNEITDRNQRMNNVIIYNVPESKEKDPELRRNDDTTKSTEILSSFNNPCPKILTSLRLGKPKDQICRPLKIVLQDSTTALNILRRKHLYEGPAEFSSDKTLQQRKYMKELRVKVLELNSTPGNQKKIIKYINGTPKIIDEHQKNPMNSKNLPAETQ